MQVGTIYTGRCQYLFLIPFQMLPSEVSIGMALYCVSSPSLRGGALGDSRGWGRIQPGRLPLPKRCGAVRQRRPPFPTLDSPCQLELDDLPLHHVEEDVVRAEAVEEGVDAPGTQQPDQGRGVQAQGRATRTAPPWSPLPARHSATPEHHASRAWTSQLTNQATAPSFAVRFPRFLHLGKAWPADQQPPSHTAPPRATHLGR